MSARTELAHLFMTGKVEAPASRRDARLMPALIKSGRAASLQKGIVHQVKLAAIATDGRTATVSARWACGGGTMNAGSSFSCPTSWHRALTALRPSTTPMVHASIGATTLTANCSTSVRRSSSGSASALTGAGRAGSAKSHGSLASLTRPRLPVVSRKRWRSGTSARRTTFDNNTLEVEA